MTSSKTAQRLTTALPWRWPQVDRRPHGARLLAHLGGRPPCALSSDLLCSRSGWVPGPAAGAFLWGRCSAARPPAARRFETCWRARPRGRLVLPAGAGQRAAALTRQACSRARRILRGRQPLFLLARGSPRLGLSFPSASVRPCLSLRSALGFSCQLCASVTPFSLPANQACVSPCLTARDMHVPLYPLQPGNPRLNRAPARSGWAPGGVGD